MRIFVALPFPQVWMQPLLGTLTQARNVKGRWEHPDNYHITLRFIGEVDDETRDQYIVALKTIQASAFEMALQGLGRFPPSPNLGPRVLWVGLAPSQALLALHKAVSDVLEDNGLPKDKHEAFQPHMTVVASNLVILQKNWINFSRSMPPSKPIRY